MRYNEIKPINSCAELIECVRELGFLPLLQSGVAGYSAEEMVDDDCRYVTFPDGGWDWPLWKWKGSAISDGHCVYGKFFSGKAGFVSSEWWPIFCAYRRAVSPKIEEDSIEYLILQTLREEGSMITRQLRRECGFTGPKMRSRFDAYITRLQMSCRIVTQDFVYPQDIHGHEYGWGWALLTIPEQLLGSEVCPTSETPDLERERLLAHFRQILPQATERQLSRLV